MSGDSTLVDMETAAELPVGDVDGQVVESSDNKNSTDVWGAGDMYETQLSNSEHHDSVESKSADIATDQYDPALPGDAVAQEPMDMQFISAPVDAQFVSAPVDAQFVSAPVDAQFVSAPVDAQFAPAPMDTQFVPAPMDGQFVPASMDAQSDSAPSDVNTLEASNEQVQPGVCSQVSEAMVCSDSEGAIAEETQKEIAEAVEAPLSQDAVEAPLSQDAVEAPLSQDAVEAPLSQDAVEAPSSQDAAGDAHPCEDPAQDAPPSDRDSKPGEAPPDALPDSTEQQQVTMEEAAGGEDTPVGEGTPGEAQPLPDVAEPEPPEEEKPPEDKPPLTREELLEERKKRKVERQMRLAEQKGITELDKFWKAVVENPSDFTGWTYLLQYVEQQNALEEAREAFDDFLDVYPFCFGYWKKYADVEKRHQNLEMSEEVFERGIKGIHMSVDLWLHYINFYKERHCNDHDFEEQMRSLFERAVTIAGGEFKSDRLWEAYCNWEREQSNLRNVTAVFDRLLATRIQHHSANFKKFEEHVNKHHPCEILCASEFLDFRTKYLETIKTEVKEEEEEEPPASLTLPPGEDEAADEAMPPGEEAPVAPSSDETTPAVKVKSAEQGNNEEVASLRKMIIESRSEIFEKTAKEILKRKPFEDQIKRPYFHVKPLERNQLKVWREYLDFEIENGTHESVVTLFDRCVIACALYEDFWMKYAKYMESKSLDAVREIYRRGCMIHLPKKLNIHLTWALFEEIHGNYEGATRVLENIERRQPDLLVVPLRRISLERRLQHHRSVEELYQKYMGNAPNPQAEAFFAVRFARYYLKVMQNAFKAKEVLRATLSSGNTSVRIYQQLLDTAMQTQPPDEELALDTFESVMHDEAISKEEKLRFSERRLEFVEEFSANISKIVDFYEEHKKLEKVVNDLTKKRGASSAETPPAKKTKTDVMPTTSNGGARQPPYYPPSNPPPQQQPPPTSTHDTSNQYNAYNAWANYNQQAYGYNQGYNQGYSQPTSGYSGQQNYNQPPPGYGYSGQPYGGSYYGQ
ncbi:PREDICTED: pre-mRNA-processing factor 39-like [Priapulus caudatus]|uniref:Pre-mRNA-processing factor 39-like n=1 Tax=Priapulus caudatus TaxID=37621 RepID=A0ABM1DPF6_PRICU|nr:PREDICTED: pre-mRNA-processing factor 39-like [Priapulus caudatus]XP_014661825.1 PREDICTED: pre-mRNA-processing factor 39-like [Priapulus caudatus]XP_014661827.1 PREDICTED: pre-mRNA-processing factor 39-like [Priapulus caudatus]